MQIQTRRRDRRIRRLVLALWLALFAGLLVGCEPIFTVIPYHEHTFSDTWSGDGQSHWREATCEHEELTVDRGAHVIETIPGREATLTQTGITEGERCSVCGKVLRAQQVIPALDPDHTHTFELDWTHDESSHWHASTCGHTGVVQNRAEHVPQTLPAVPPTRETTGLTEGVGCSVCGRVLVAQQQIPRLTEDTVRVMVACQQGARVVGESSVMVAVGESISFQLQLDSTYVVTSTSAGTYRDGVLTVGPILGATTVYVYTEDLGYDTSVIYRFLLYATAADLSSAVSGSMLSAGTPIQVRAADPYRIFLGWSLGNTLDKRGTLISEERELSFRLSPSVVTRGICRLYANYSDPDVYYYDANGGVVDTSSQNMSATGYYTATLESGRVQVSLSEDYLSYAESVSTFWDDATFTRAGYRLVGYNTLPDGSGEWYSLGSKFYAAPVGDAPAVLYCMWLPETPASDFTYEPCQISRPSGVSAAYAPHWYTDGVRITGYTGDDDTVVIPQMLGGRYVISIAADAFANKSMTTLSLPRTLLQVQDGAFAGCTSLDTLWYSDGIYYISDAAFGEATLRSLHHLYVNATVAPRFSHTGDGAFAVKLSRLLASEDARRIIVISGSSSYQGLSSAYMEALLGDGYRLVNFGTTRTTNGILYLEAMQHYADADDIIVYAPENSVYMMGETELYWKTLRDLEGMYNLYRYVDIAHYTGVFAAFADFNVRRMTQAPQAYEAIAAQQQRSTASGRVNLYGEYLYDRRAGYCDDSRYTDTYLITMNERYKSMLDGKGAWNDSTSADEANAQYRDPQSQWWVDITEERYVSEMNRAIALARSGGAAVYFSFAPVDADKLSTEARSVAWLQAYDAMIASTFAFDGLLGSSVDYVLAHTYFYDCAYHLNDYGRAYRTYQMYRDLSALWELRVRDFDAEGKIFEGCLFEPACVDGTPVTRVAYLPS